MKPIDVLLVGPVPPPYAGPEMVTRTLLKLAPRYGVRYRHIDTSNRSNAAKGSVHVANVVRAGRQVLRFLGGALVHRMRGGRIAHIPLSQNTTGVLRDIVLIRIAQLLGYETIVHFHGGQFDQFYARTMLKPIVSGVLRRATRLIVLGSAISRQFPFVAKDRIVVLPNPVDPEWLDLFPEDTDRDAHPPLKILFVGHLSRAKGLVDLVEAVAQVAQHKAVELHCVGSPIDKERNIRVAGRFMDQGLAAAKSLVESRGLRHAVFFHEPVSGPKKRDRFWASHVLCLPSYSEGMPLVVLEAMFSGLAVIASNVGAIADIIDARWTVEPGRVDALAARIMAMTPSRAQDIGRAYRKRAQDHYHPAKIVQRLRAIYDEVLA